MKKLAQSTGVCASRCGKRREQGVDGRDLVNADGDVTGGVVALIAVGLRYQGGRYNADDLEITGLYWHFVDLVWMFVVPFVYLMNLAH